MRNKGETLKQHFPLPGSSLPPLSPHSSPPTSGTEGDGPLGGQYAAASLCHSFLLMLFLCSSMGSPLSTARTVPVQPRAASGPFLQKPPLPPPHYQHTGTVTQYTATSQRCIWACPLSGLSPSHQSNVSCTCLWIHQDRQLFPVHGIPKWEKGSSSTLPMMKRHHTDDRLLFFFFCLLLWIILQLWISLCTYCAEFYSDVSKSRSK